MTSTTQDLQRHFSLLYYFSVALQDMRCRRWNSNSAGSIGIPLRTAGMVYCRFRYPPQGKLLCPAVKLLLRFLSLRSILPAHCSLCSKGRVPIANHIPITVHGLWSMPCAHRSLGSIALHFSSLRISLTQSTRLLNFLARRPAMENYIS